MLIKNNEGNYVLSCDKCNKESREFKSISEAMKFQFDNGWLIDTKDKKNICNKCLNRGK